MESPHEHFRRVIAETGDLIAAILAMRSMEYHKAMLANGGRPLAKAFRG
jgi:hypothetical protein